jgi:hypothetical protein
MFAVAYMGRKWNFQMFSLHAQRLLHETVPVVFRPGKRGWFFGPMVAEPWNSNRFGVNSSTVAQYVIEREVPGAGSLSDVQIREMSLRSLEALNAMGPQIQWLHSYVTEDKVYCVYLAPDEDTIREHARRAGIPADRVSAVRRLVDPLAL